MKKRFGLIIILFLVAVMAPKNTWAQNEEETLRLSLTRNFGYGGMGKIQGNFTLKVNSIQQDLLSVEFYFDNELVATVKEEPFQYQFHTSEFSDGEHVMYAIGLLVSGRTLESNGIKKTFLSSEQAWSETQNILVPLFIGTAILALLGVGVPMLFSRNRNFVLGEYGPAGGAVCPRCELPFSRPLLAPNLVVGKLVRCPHCGKIGILARASRPRLQEAEGKLGNQTDSGISGTGLADLNTLIDESRFED